KFIFNFFISLSICNTQFSKFFSTSLLQNLKIVHPFFVSSSLTSLSLSMFLSILLYQNSRFVLWSLFRLCQSFPCQNSPSTKMASLMLLKVKSGFPKTVLLFFRYRWPLAKRVLANKSSDFVPVDLLACIFFFLCSLVNL